METQELKWWHVRWRPSARALSRVAIIGGKILGVLCVVGAIGWGVLFVLSPWLFARRMSEFDPRLNLVPINLPSNAQAPLSGPVVEHYGFRFQLPEVETSKFPETRSLVVARFHEGALIVRSPADEYWSFLSTIRNDKRADELLTKETLHSKFLLMQAAMSTAPEQIKWWRFRSAGNERAQLLLMAKFFAITESFTRDSFSIRPFYRIGFGEVHGFQFGNPDVAPYEAHLDLFDGANRHLTLDVNGTEGHGQVLTQEQLNGLVASIGPVSDH